MKVKTAFMSFAFALLLFGSIVNETHSGLYITTKAETHWFSANASVYPGASNVNDMAIGMYTGYGNAYVIVGGKYRGSSGNMWLRVYSSGMRRHIMPKVILFIYPVGLGNPKVPLLQGACSNTITLGI